MSGMVQGGVDCGGNQGIAVSGSNRQFCYSVQMLSGQAVQLICHNILHMCIFHIPSRNYLGSELQLCQRLWGGRSVGQHDGVGDGESSFFRVTERGFSDLALSVGVQINVSFQKKKDKSKGINHRMSELNGGSMVTDAVYSGCTTSQPCSVL